MIPFVVVQCNLLQGAASAHGCRWAGPVKGTTEAGTGEYVGRSPLPLTGPAHLLCVEERRSMKQIARALDNRERDRPKTKFHRGNSTPGMPALWHFGHCREATLTWG